MRSDFSLNNNSSDILYKPYSISTIPNYRSVFDLGNLNGEYQLFDFYTTDKKIATSY